MLFFCCSILSLISLALGTLGISYLYVLGIGSLFGISYFFDKKRCIVSLFVGLLIAYSSWSIWATQYELQLKKWKSLDIVTDHFTKKVSVRWCIDSLAYNWDFTATYRLKIDTIDTFSPKKYNQNIGIFIDVPKNLTLKSGDCILFNNKVLSTLSFPLSGFERYSWKSNMYGKSSVPTFVTTHRSDSTPLENVHTWAIKNLSHWFPQNITSIVLGMTIGNTWLLSKATKNDFLLSGTTHILVVSGSNIAFVILIVLFLLRYLRIWSTWRILSVIILVIAYGSLVWWDAPVLRAVIMGIITYLGLQYEKRISSVTLLLGICVLLSLYNPFLLLYDAGFWLSFWATFWILLFQKKIQWIIEKIHLGSLVSSIVSVTLWASIGSLPLLIFHFWVLSLGGIIANILIAVFLWPLLIFSVIYLGLIACWITGLYYPWLFVYIPAKVILMITWFFSWGYQLHIDEALRAPISMFLLGCLLYFFFQSELTKLVSRESEEGWGIKRYRGS